MRNAKQKWYSSPVSSVVALGWYAGHYWEIGRQLHSCVQRDISDCCANPIISTSEGNYVLTFGQWRKIKTVRSISEWHWIRWFILIQFTSNYFGYPLVLKPCIFGHFCRSSQKAKLIFFLCVCCLKCWSIFWRRFKLS